MIESSSLLKYLKERGGGNLESILRSNTFKNDSEWVDFFRREFVQKKNPKDLESVDLTFEEEIIVKTENMLVIQELENIFRRVHFSDLQIIRSLGRGVYGSTYLCSIQVKKDQEKTKRKVIVSKKKEEETEGEDQEDGFERIPALSGFFVVKIFNDTSSTKKKKAEVLRKDRLYLPYHPNVVPILGHKDNEVIKICSLPDYEKYWKERTFSKETVEGGMVLMKYHRMNLKEFINNKEELDSRFEKKEIFRLIYGVVKGMMHLNFNRIVHRDLHFGNIFLDPKFGRIWIGDFGCALDLRKYPGGFIVKKDDEILLSLYSYSAGGIFQKGGLSKILAPEIHKAFENNEDFIDYTKSDTYSVGLIGKYLFEKFSGEFIEGNYSNDVKRRSKRKNRVIRTQH